MGCWYQTCGISQLAILHREPCRLVFIRKQPGWRGDTGRTMVHPTDLWKPVSMPILGTYTDHGSLEGADPQSWQVRTFLKWCSERIVEQELGENTIHDLPIRRSEITVESLQDHIHSQGERVLLLDSLGRSLAANRKQQNYIGDLLGFELIREDVYQALANTPFHGPRGTTSRETLKEELHQWFEAKCEVIESLGDTSDPSARWRAFFALRDEHSTLWSSEDGVLWDYGNSMTERFMDKDLDLDALRAEVVATFDDFAAFRMVSWHMGGLRKAWGPQCGAGSQDDGVEEQERFLGIQRDALHRMRTRYDEEPVDITAAFWKAFQLPTIRRSPERVKLIGEITDAAGEPIPGLAECKGDGDGYGSLYVVDAPPKHLYFVISETGRVERIEHTRPVHESYTFLHPVDPGEAAKFI